MKYLAAEVITAELLLGTNLQMWWPLYHIAVKHPVSLLFLWALLGARKFPSESLSR